MFHRTGEIVEIHYIGRFFLRFAALAPTGLQKWVGSMPEVGVLTEGKVILVLCKK
jgi:hypothetical protein